MSRSSKARLTKVLVACASLLTPLFASANDYHYINTPVGNRAAGMGGAYTALSDDTSGLYYNPAGIVYSPGSSLSGSMNAFQQSNIVYKNVLGGQYDWERSSGTLLPNFFGVIQPLGNVMFGFSYAVPNSSVEDQDQVFSNVSTSLGTAEKFIINFNNDDKTYNFGPSLAYQVNDQLSIGATLYFHYRHLQRISNIVMFFASDRYWNNNYFEMEEYGYKPVLGVMWSPTERVSLGLSMSKVEVTGTDISSYTTCLGANNSSPPAASLCQPGALAHQVVTSDQTFDYPLRTALGITWFVSDALLLSYDMIHHESIGEGVNYRESVINMALGAEYYLSPTWALRGGFYTDYANTPELQENFTSYSQPEHIDLFGMSASISHFNRNSSITFGFTYSQGSGKAQMVSGDATLQDAEMESSSIFMAASYAY